MVVGAKKYDRGSFEDMPHKFYVLQPTLPHLLLPSQHLAGARTTAKSPQILVSSVRQGDLWPLASVNGLIQLAACALSVRAP